MIEPTSEDMKEWLNNPCTKAFFNLVGDAVNTVQHTPIYQPGMDASVVSVAAAHKEGLVEGLREVINIIEEFKKDEEET